MTANYLRFLAYLVSVSYDPVFLMPHLLWYFITLETTKILERNNVSTTLSRLLDFSLREQRNHVLKYESDCVIIGIGI
jgi:hypothetical protein